MAQKLVLEMAHDTNKTLKEGKRRYGDESGHNLYLSGEEVKQIGESDKVTVTVEPA